MFHGRIDSLPLHLTIIPQSQISPQYRKYPTHIVIQTDWCYILGSPKPLIGNYMIRRLLLVLQSISLIPPIGMFFFWGKYIFTDWNTGFLEIVSIHLLSFIPFTLLFLGKYIVYGKFYIFKNEEGEENKLRDSSRKDDSKNSNQDSYEPPFPDGFWNIPY